MNTKIIAIVATGVLGTSYIACKKLLEYTQNRNTKKPESLSTFAVWGLPNSGKTTFINQLRGHPISEKKEATTSAKHYKKVEVQTTSGNSYLIDEISDMPGNADRKEDWLQLVKEKTHVFYIINLVEAEKSNHMSMIRQNVQATIKSLKESEKPKKRIHLIFSHLDKSKWKEINPSEVNNNLQSDQNIREIYESMEGVSGYVYSANLTDKHSFEQLLESITNDCRPS